MLRLSAELDLLGEALEEALAGRASDHLGAGVGLHSIDVLLEGVGECKLLLVSLRQEVVGFRSCGLSGALSVLLLADELLLLSFFLLRVLASLGLLASLLLLLLDSFKPVLLKPVDVLPIL